MLLIENTIVGITILFVYLCTLSLGINNQNQILLITGFCKHLLGYFSGLQDIYCNVHKQGSRNNVYFCDLLLESLLEGFVFVMYGILLARIIPNEQLIPIVIAFTIHLVAEFTGVHQFFIKTHCEK